MMAADTFPSPYERALHSLICNADYLDRSWNPSQDKFSQLKTVGDGKEGEKDGLCFITLVVESLVWPEQHIG